MENRCYKCLTMEYGDCAIKHFCKWFDEKNFTDELLRRANKAKKVGG
jgi:hypothetical protein